MGEIQADTAVAVSGRADAGVPLPDGVRLVPVASLQPLPNQPRRNFDEDALDELARSITALGVLQPIVVRDLGGQYQIVAGERRWRAAQRAKLHQVPVIVKQFDDRTALEIALVENIQREQLNAWEEGETYRRLIDDYGHSQEELGRVVGKSRSHVANTLRLLNLSATIREHLRAGRLSAGHARALLGAEEPEKLASQILTRGLSVRQAEALAAAQPKNPDSRRTTAKDSDTLALERRLLEKLGLHVAIKHFGKGGQVTINYADLDQLDGLIRLLMPED